MGDKTEEQCNPLWYEPVGKTMSKVYNPKQYFENESIQSLLKDCGDFLPDNPEEEEVELNARIRKFIGTPIADDKFEKLSIYCSNESITDEQQVFRWTPVGKGFPTIKGKICKLTPPSNQEVVHTNTQKRFKSRMKLDPNYVYRKCVKRYNGLIPDVSRTLLDIVQKLDKPVAGKDLIFKIKKYHPYNRSSLKCNQEVLILGKSKLTELRDIIKCPNDLGLTVDCSNAPNSNVLPSVQSIFPSGFFFINGIFYEDRRVSTHTEYSAVIRQWAKEKGIGDFPVKSMENSKLEDLPIRLGNPEVYIHQGQCEHLFTISSVRLATPYDSLHLPASCRGLSTLNMVTCMMCGNSVSKWLVLDSQRFIFQPAYYCDICFKNYNYKDGQKLEDFKAYRLHVSE